MDQDGRTADSQPIEPPELAPPLDATILGAVWHPTVGDLAAIAQDPSQSIRPKPHEDSPATALMNSGAQALAPTRIEWPPLFAGRPQKNVAANPGSGLDIELGEAIGKGGMGVVHKAWQKSIQRDIAVKRLNAEKVGPEGFRSFVEEATVAGYLDHPNIVPVHFLAMGDFGEPLIAMKLVNGVSWKQLLQPATEQERRRAAAMSRDDHLRILLNLCNAVSYAHSKGIIHCDLKPDNVMIGDFGEVLLMDWGVAIDVEPDAEGPRRARPRNEVTAAFGTPCYMAPELAEGRAEQLGRWTDVYLLGAVLHELLVGEPPHRADGFLQVLLKASQSKEPRFEAQVPLELQEICRAAMARDPAQRPPSVESFRQRLTAFLDHEESLQVSARAGDMLRRCEQTLETGAAALPEAMRSRLYADFWEASTGFRQAYMLWSGNSEAVRGEVTARLAFATAAISCGDLGVAEAQLNGLELESPSAVSVGEALGRARSEQQRSRKAAKRLRATVTIATAVVLLVCLVGFIAVNQARESEKRQRQTAEAQRGVARTRQREAERARAAERTQRQRAEAQSELASARLKDVTRLADVKLAADLLAEERSLWPASSARVEAMGTWLDEARRMLERRGGHEQSAARYQERLKATRPTVQEAPELHWKLGVLKELLGDLAQIRSLTAAVEARRERARSLYRRSVETHRELWDRAIETIRDRSVSPSYRGFRLAPIEGLVPLGTDPQSKLQEFALLETGAVPKRDAEGRLLTDADSAAILILLPAGQFDMGSTKEDRKNEQPVHRVGFAQPFLIGKHEVTQGQWLRTMGSNPSRFKPGVGKGTTLEHPVENVSWNESRLMARRFGCGLPSESQWEYACRAGTTTSWWTGDERRSLQGAANLADLSFAAVDAQRNAEDWNDGHSTHAPVGMFRANPFGLHDISGNLWEWCEDGYLERYQAKYVLLQDGRQVVVGVTPEPLSQGLPRGAGSPDGHVRRGGSWCDSARFLRAAYRDGYESDFRLYNLGLRLARSVTP